MTEEVNLEVAVEEKQESVVQQPSEYEVKALEQGWKPKEEWEGNPEDWRPAREFVERGELFGKISSQNNELKELRKTLNYLTDHHRKVKESEFARAVTHLKAMKKEALESGDADKVVEVDEAIADVKQQQQAFNTLPKETQPAAPHPAFVQFVKDNGWYSTDAEMKSFADEIGVGYKTRNPEISPEELFAYVSKRVKQSYPDKFKVKPTAPTVEGGSTSNGNKGVKEYALTEDERRAMMSFVRQGIMTKEEYIKELKSIKGDE